MSSRVRAAAARRALAGAVLASLAAAAPAMAAEGPQGIRAGHNITVFHNIDMIAAFGSTVGEQTQVDVFRAGHRIASARGAAADTPEGGALEVNHGPAGLPVAGDCWVGATPDIRPGDRIVVSNPGGSAGVDEAIVDDISLTGRSVVTRDADTGGEVVVLTPATPEAPETTEPTREEIWVEGVAEYVDANGARTPIPIEALDSAEFLGMPDDNQLRMAPNEVVAGSTPGTFIAKYYDEDPGDPRAGFDIDRNRNNRSDAYIFDAIVDGEGHAIGYGHVAVLPPVSMLVDGFEEQTTAALGCEAAPKLPSSLGTASTELLSIANAGPGATDPVLTLGGWAAAGVTAAKVVLTSGGTSVEKDVDLAVDATGQQGWGASFAAADLAGLAEGDVQAQLSIDGVLVGAVRTLRYDVTAPELSVDLPEGAYTGPQRVVVTGGAAGDTITYVLDGAPARTYSGGAIELAAGDHVLVLRSTDAAGNVTERTLAYAVAPAPEPAKEPATDDAPAAKSEAPVASIAQDSAAPVVIDSRTSAQPPTASMRRGRVTVKRATARRSGVVAGFTAPEGARTALIRVSRVRNGRLTPIGSRTAAVRAGVNRIALSSKSLRSKLTAGSYVIEVTLRGADGVAGASAVTTLKIVR